MIGTDYTGTAALGNAVGARLDTGAHDNTVGGTAARAGNLISGNAGTGVAIVDVGTTGNAVRGNAVHANGGPGIDLGGDDVTANDTDDADAGPNGYQNFPVLASALAGATTPVSGTLHSLPNATFTLDFYASAAADPSGYGEGERYLGSTSLTTDGAGVASFGVTLNAATVKSEFITATATDAAGNTSEFSAATSALTEGPSITAGNLTHPASTGEGHNFTLDGTFQDLGGPNAHTVVIQWGDGQTTTLPTLAAGTTSFSAPHAYADSGTYAITVTDDASRSGTAASTITVTNVAPTLTVAGPNQGVPNQTLSFTLTAVDVSPTDQAGNFTFGIDWDNDGSVDQTVLGPSGTVISRSFAAVGSYPFAVRATDKDGGVSGWASYSVQVNNVVIEQDPTTGETVASVGGTSATGATSTITITATDTGASIAVNGDDQGTFTADRYVVHGGAGNDVVTAEAELGESVQYVVQAMPTESDFTLTGTTTQATLTGQGTDTLYNVTTVQVTGNTSDNVIDASGFSGDTILSGGGGSDTLIGGSGNNTFVKTDDMHGDLTAEGGGEGSTNEFLVVPASDITLIDGGGFNTLNFSLARLGVTFDLNQSAGQKQYVYAFDASTPTDRLQDSLAIVGRFQKLVDSPQQDNLCAARPVLDATGALVVNSSTLVARSGGDRLFGGLGASITAFAGDNLIADLGFSAAEFEGHLGFLRGALDGLLGVGTGTDAAELGFDAGAIEGLLGFLGSYDTADLGFLGDDNAAVLGLLNGLTPAELGFLQVSVRASGDGNQFRATALADLTLSGSNNLFVQGGLVVGLGFLSPDSEGLLGFLSGGSVSQSDLDFLRVMLSTANLGFLEDGVTQAEFDSCNIYCRERHSRSRSGQRPLRSRSPIFAAHCWRPTSTSSPTVPVRRN